MRKCNYLYGEILKSEVTSIINILEINKKATVIDIGCGNARFLCALIKEADCNGIGVEPVHERYAKAILRRKLKKLDNRLELKNNHYPCELDNKYTHVIIHGCIWEKDNIMPVYKAIPKNVKILHNSFAFNKENQNIKQYEISIKTNYAQEFGTKFWHHTK